MLRADLAALERIKEERRIEELLNAARAAIPVAYYSTVQDEGAALTQRAVLNFTGAGVTASDSGGKTVVNIPGGAGAAWSTTTVDFGATPVAEATFTIVDATVGVGSIIPLVVSGGDSTADNDALAHAEAALRFCMAATPAAGSFDLYVMVLGGLVTGTFDVRYKVES